MYGTFYHKDCCFCTIPNSYPDGDVTSEWYNRWEVVVVEATSVSDGQTAASVVTDLSPVIVHCFITSLCSAEAEACSASIPRILSWQAEASWLARGAFLAFHPVLIKDTVNVSQKDTCVKVVLIKEEESHFKIPWFASTAPWLVTFACSLGLVSEELVLELEPGLSALVRTCACRVTVAGSANGKVVVTGWTSVAPIAFVPGQTPAPAVLSVALV